MTFDTWLNGQLQRPGARTMLATTAANIFATEPANMSFLHVLFYIRSSVGWESLVKHRGRCATGSARGRPSGAGD
jgi:monoamine oxidase